MNVKTFSGLLFAPAVFAAVAASTGCSRSSSDAPPDTSPAATLPPIARTLSTGDGHVLALDASSHIFGWGSNQRGELGLPGACSLPVPKLVDASRRWQSVDAGTRASYAIARDGELWRREFPRWPEGECAKDRRPLPYESLNWDSRWQKVQEAWGIAAGIDASGDLQLWNDDEIKPEASRDMGGRAQAALARAEPKTHWQDFCLAIHRVYAIAEDGTLWTNALQAGTWDRVGAAQLAKFERVPGDAAPLARVFCHTNATHVLALDANGSLWGLGDDKFGELGDGDGDAFTQTQPVTQLKRVTKARWNDIAVGSGFTIGIKSDGTLWAWGNNAHGTLGVGSNDYSDIPRAVDSERPWTAVAAAYGFALGATRDSELFAWGENTNGVLGDGGGSSVHTTPARVYGQERWQVQK
jgi:alpha-tubulin suppressor-like RCC1 family protein